MTAELLELLLPVGSSDGSGGGPGGRAGDETRRRALAAIQLSRLLCGLGTGPDAGRVDLDLARAAADLDQRLTSEALDRCEALFGAHLERAPGRSTLVPWPGRTSEGDRATWEGLLGLVERAGDLPLPSLPEPAEEPGAVARRLLLAASCLGLAPGRAELWRALLEHGEGDRDAAEGRMTPLVEDEGLDHATRVAATTALLGALLERGAVRRARDLVLERLDLVASDPELQRRAAWACLVGGEAELAAELALPTPASDLPPVLLDLGRRRPALRGDLTGGATWGAPTPRASGTGRAYGRGRRSEVGAALLAVFVVEDGAVNTRHLEVAPGLGHALELDDWLADRALAPWDPAELEAEILAGGPPRVSFPSPAEPGGRRLLRSCLTPGVRAMALAPIVGGDGAILGWLRLEFEHELVPTDADLQALAAAMGRRLGLERTSRPARQPGGGPGRLAELLEPVLGGQTHRRWWVLDAEDRALEQGGEGLSAHEPGGGRLLAEARRLGLGRCLTGAPDPDASYHGGARSALAMPLGPGWSVASPWLVVESARAGDLGPELLASWGRALELPGRAALLARFSAWHRARRDHGLHLDPAPLDPPPSGGTRASHAAPGDLGTGELLQRLGRAPAGAWCFQGPPGSGRGTAARLATFLQTGSGDLSCISLRGVTRERLAAFLESGGPRLLEDLEALEDDGVEALLVEAVQAGEPRAPLLLHGLPGALPGALGRILAGRVLELAPFATRRRERAGIFARLLRREALASRRLPPASPPELDARLWRADLDLTGLADLARRLVDLRPGGELEAADLELVLAEVDLPPRRLPSKSPDPRALWAALDGTRKVGGSFHRRRAAAYLGWDPDTVSVRIKDLGWSDLG